MALNTQPTTASCSGAIGSTLGGYVQQAAQNAYPEASFAEFCKREAEYHKAMQEMYEFMAANELLAGNTKTGELMRTIFTMGISALAGNKT